MTDYFFLLYKFKNRNNSNNRILITGKNVTETFTDTIYVEMHDV